MKVQSPMPWRGAAVKAAPYWPNSQGADPNKRSLVDDVSNRVGYLFKHRGRWHTMVFYNRHEAGLELHLYEQSAGAHRTIGEAVRAATEWRRANLVGSFWPREEALRG